MGSRSVYCSLLSIEADSVQPWGHTVMRLSGTAVELSASDLSQSLACRHLTALNLAVALGRRSPPSWRDPALGVLQQRGLDHERGYVDGLRAQKLTIIDLSDNEADDAIANSIDAMRSGVDVVVQAALRNGRWFGKPDVLRRVERQSALGVWSYEVIDTKLAKDKLLPASIREDIIERSDGIHSSGGFGARLPSAATA